MSRFKTFDATGIAPNGRLYAGDLNAIQDMKADQTNFGQTIDLATARFGDTSIQLLKYGPSEARFTSALRTDGILRGLGGLFSGTYTTAQRDAIPAGLRPYGLLILNTSVNKYQWNAGSDASPSWQDIAPTLGTDSITNAMLTDNSVGTNEIVDGAVTYAELAGSLKPSVSAGASSEALRAIGNVPGGVTAWNDSRLSDQRTPLDNSVTNAKIVAGAGIPYSKLSLAGSITNNDIVAGAGINYSKLSLAGSITAADLTNAVKPSTGAAPGTEALRAIGTDGNSACAGNDIRLTGVSVVTYNGGNYTLALSDAGAMVRMGSGSANTLTVPTNGSVPFPVNTIVNVMQYGGGNTTIAAAGGVTLRYTPGLRFVAQFAMASLVKLAADEWLVSGNLAA